MAVERRNSRTGCFVVVVVVVVVIFVCVMSRRISSGTKATQKRLESDSGERRQAGPETGTNQEQGLATVC